MSNGENIAVPKRTHVPIISVLLVSIGATFGAFGIGQIMGVFTSFTSSITSYITQSLQWDAMWSGLVVGVFFLVLSAVAFKSSAKFKSWSNRVKSAFIPNVDMQPSTFYDLDVVPSEYIVKNMVNKRGCKLSESKNGFTISCPNEIMTPKMRKMISGEEDRFAVGTRLAIIVFINMMILLPPFMIRNGSMDLVYGPWVWYAFLVIGIMLFYEAMILPMWALVIMYILHTAIAMILSPEILVIVNVAIPGAIIFFGITLTMYMFKSEQCQAERNWWCDRL